LLDIGDGVALLKLHGKMNTLGARALDLINQSLDMVDQSGFVGLVLGSANTSTFSAGANLVELLAEVDAGHWDELDAAVRASRTPWPDYDALRSLWSSRRTD
jgi:enoyl-CoA hydratase/carnithine racemase